MEDETKKNSFEFTYSAKEQEELKKIRAKYEPKEESKMEKLRRLDASVTKKATIHSIVIGLVGTLLLGGGMSFIMTDFGQKIGLTGIVGMGIGILIGIVGLVFVCAAYPVYHYFLKKERKKVAPKILQLTEELMGNTQF